MEKHRLKEFLHLHSQLANKRMEYNFQSFKDFFEYHFNKTKTGPDGARLCTLNDLAEKLGYSSPSLLSMIANGKRLPSSTVLEMLFEEWNIDSSQREMIRVWIEIEKKKRKNKSTTVLVEKLAKLDKKSKFKSIDIDRFNSIKEWYNTALLMLVTSPDFKEDYHLISQQLRKKATPTQIRKGFETLLKVGLLKRNSYSGELEIKTDSSHETTHDIPSEAIREHHRGMITRALEAIDEQSVEERHLNSLTLKLSKENYKMAKEDILNFVKEFNDKYHSKNSNHVFQLNVQLFEHTNDHCLKSNKDTLQ
jgi:uncharacterized protein (TIGR02147 family)